MTLTVQIFQVIFYCVAILFMITLIILSIWSFVIFNKIYKNQRINNFLLDKINQSILNHTNIKYQSSKENLNVDDFIDENELFDSDKHDSNDNIISF